MTRRGTLVLAILVTLLIGAAPVAAHDGDKDDGRNNGSLPARIVLPAGFQPEGLTAGRGSTFYVGSLANGAIYRGSFKTGAGAILVPGVAGRVAVGTDYEKRHDRLWVAGGSTHEVRAYNASTGALLATYTFPGGFLNDLVATRQAIYVTDSNSQQIAVIPLGDGGALPAPASVLVRPLTGDIAYATGFNANGIASTGRWLILVQSNTGLLFRVDPTTGTTRRIDLGTYSVANGDGVEVVGRTIYVVRNTNNLVAVLKANRSFESARLRREITSPGNLDVPTTAVVHGNRLWVVNARFGNATPSTADYWITRLSAKP